MKVEWSVRARASARRFMNDQAAMREIIAAVNALSDDPEPPGAFVRGEWGRLRLGDYRIFYLIRDDLILIDHVDRITPPPADEE